jgi:flagellin-like hook-associated protein FlgL
LFALFEGFVDALDTDVATPELVEYASKFSKAQDDVLSLISDVGGRQKRLEHINTRYENEFINCRA